ncbi:flagellar hook-associated protein FlgK [Roseococcus sp. DSY-14]|uniref:flagellar hook-associated protein FlgK n=1 Tax=Roseococcus sp. DSY-14 TaxID=3369650 RepID=UPI00387B1E44
MSLDLAFGIARTGLLATQQALANVSQNIANARTEGYTRKQVDMSATAWAGQPMGVRAGVAARTVDAALVNERNARAADAAAAGLRERLLGGIEAAHGTPEAGDTLADGVGALQTAFLALRDSPADSGLQRAALGAARDLASRFNDVARAVAGAREEAHTGIAAEVALLNRQLRAVAGLSAEIVATRASGASTAALEDQRDAAIATLSESLPVRPIARADGGVTLVAGGLTLPLDPNRDVFGFAQGAIGAASFHGGAGTLAGVTLQGTDVTARLSGGRLGEMLRLRDETLPRFAAELDVAAASLAARMDAQGLRLFTDGAGAVPDVAQPYAAPAGGQLGFAALMQVSASAAQDPRLLRDGTHAVAASPGGPTAFTPNPPGGPAGFTGLLDRVAGFALGEEASAGNPWPAFASGGLGPDGTLSSPFFAPRGVAGFAAALAAAQVADRAAATEAKDRATGLRDGLDARFAAQSGVGTDAEMAAMVQLQNAYAANARVMNTAQEMWDLLLSIGR